MVFFDKLSLPKRHLAALLLVCSLFFIGNGQFELFDNSETHYTRVAQEMDSSKDYLNLYFNGKNWFVHPPLYFWQTNIMTSFLGWSNTVLRLQSAIFSSLSVFTLYFLGRLFFMRHTAIIASIIFGTSFYIIALGKLAIFDAQLYFCMLISLYFILRFIHDDRHRSKWMIYAGLFTGIGILTKGPISIVQQLLFLGPYILLIKRVDILKNKNLWIGALIAILIAAPWYTHQLMVHGKPFFDAALRDYTWLRFFGVVEGQTGPWYYYFLVLFAFFPWIAWLPGLIITHLNLKPWLNKDLKSNGILFCWCAILITFIFFTIAKTKLPNYIYLMFPFLSLLIADWLDKVKNKRTIFISLFTFIIVVTLAGTQIQVYDIDQSSQLLLKMTFFVLSIPTIAFIIGNIRRKSLEWMFVVYAIINFSSIAWLTGVILPKVSEYDDVKKAAQIIIADASGTTYEVIHFKEFNPSLLVRLNKNVVLTGSINKVKDKLKANVTTYVISKEANTEPLYMISKPIKDEWVVGKSKVIKF